MSSSLDKIFNTLMSAKRKGQVLRDRDAATTNQDEKASRKTKRQHNLERMSEKPSDQFLGLIMMSH
jgi:hypothetical protein